MRPVERETQQPLHEVVLVIDDSMSETCSGMISLTISRLGEQEKIDVPFTVLNGHPSPPF